ncbi:MAG: hypothetical protein DDT42_01507 [candidate division WS2 bacterium]|uniref:Uncharacterized protein n=1 Tax=Psychracetigena formicireducens TaxID=2986056 RepID=A0A9E2F7I7_PSYF1|nr:hypothetical protein [Candidatus Psychracetigena formicireducens]MBT9145633.1 hypothetical protein [Candidatus Psychracetigena formicireducens]
MVNLHDLAVRIALIEGKKISLSVAQVKEVLKVTLIELALMEEKEVLETLRKFKERVLEIDEN